jgi:hypothetical protein
MNIKKYKEELEAAIYEGADGKLYIGEKAVENVLKEIASDQNENSTNNEQT